MASLDGGIIIQVLGEMCNRGCASQKFAQTFFLAEQPSGYYVLNDIFRFLKDDVGAEYELLEGSSVQQQAPVPAEEASTIVDATTEVTIPTVVAPAAVTEPTAAPTTSTPVKKPETVTRTTPATEQPKFNDVKSTTPAPAAAQPDTTKAMLAVNNKAGTPRASSAPAGTIKSTASSAAETPAASTAAPQPPAKSWANLVAGNQAAETRSTSASITSSIKDTPATGNANVQQASINAPSTGSRGRFHTRGKLMIIVVIIIIQVILISFITDEAAVVYVKGISDRINTDTLKAYLTDTIGAVKSIDHIAAKV
jgi:hypothetical protein